MRSSFDTRLGRTGSYVAATVCWMVLGLINVSPVVQASQVLEERKLPMRFTWVACEPDCRGWISAVGIITSETPAKFEQFSREQDLTGATVVLDSSGGSVNDAIALGRSWRAMNLRTTVGTTVENVTASGTRAGVVPYAYCESMCVFLLLAGKIRYVPDEAQVRVHQIWMGDRAERARASSYSADDLMIVERDIGRLAKYTFEMGGTGDLLEMSLSVPPWEELRRLTRDELRLANIPTTDLVAGVFPGLVADRSVAQVAQKSPQDGGGRDREVKPLTATGSARSAD